MDIPDEATGEGVKDTWVPASPGGVDTHADLLATLEAQVVYWQQELGLRDWLITLEFWPHDALDDAVARTKWHRNSKHAKIALRYPEDLAAVEKSWPQDEAGDYDISLVHELLHLKCVDLESQVSWAEEQLCNHLSRALVRAYRKTQGGAGSPVLEAARPAAGHYL